MNIELISFGFDRNEAAEGANRPPVADIALDLRLHLRGAGTADTFALVDATAGTLTAFACGSPRPVTAAIGCEDGLAAPAFVQALADLLGAGGHTVNVHHRDVEHVAAAISSH